MKRNSIFLTMLLSALLLIGCNSKTNYAIDEPFIIVSYAPAGPDDYRNLYPVHYALYDDGTFHMYSEEANRMNFGDDAPRYETQVNEYRVGKVKELIDEKKFWKLNKDITVDSEDGSFHYITVNLTDKSKTVGGLNPENENFFAIGDYVKTLGDKEERRKWIEDIENYIWEKNPD